MPNVEHVTIIGSGPAGHTAALYTSRANLKPVMFEGFSAGGIPGGQLLTTTEVENYPGFPEGIQGPALMEAFRKQSVRFETRIFTEDVVRVDLSRHPFTVASAERELTTRSLILATGAAAKRLQLPSEPKLWNKGISACAVCDGALPIFRNKPLVVVGGGDSAAEESTFLTKFASKVYLVHRRGELRASKIMQERVLKHPKIEVIWNTVVADVLGDEAVSGVRLKEVTTGRERTVACGGLFYAIGFTPNTDLVAGQLELDRDGYIVTAPGSTRTSVPGVFACGDVQDKKYRQAVTAAGSGCMAAIDCERWLAAAAA
ncbi:MAG: thioredoxin-disulfide reductase [Omnitrophica WOR_2 bacterium RIFCSPHIGHO2_02_FULL_67_20]|nr:MAG: thioredoxin-disulfide reductase [Omnitrophica WOR_2 bacterium RIFCSPHIGHO2_02_FULL_67_20]